MKHDSYSLGRGEESVKALDRLAGTCVERQDRASRFSRDSDRAAEIAIAHYNDARDFACPSRCTAALSPAHPLTTSTV